MVLNRLFARFHAYLCVGLLNYVHMHFIAISIKGPDVLVRVRVADNYGYEPVKIVEVFERRSIGSSGVRMCCTNIRKIKWKIVGGKSRIIRTMGGKGRYN
jgi:hypothetical protein